MVFKFSDHFGIFRYGTACRSHLQTLNRLLELKNLEEKNDNNSVRVLKNTRYVRTGTGILVPRVRVLSNFITSKSNINVVDNTTPHDTDESHRQYYSNAD